MPRVAGGGQKCSEVCFCGKNSLGFRVIFGPDPFELIQVVWPENGPITGQIVKVIHDDGNKQVDDLKTQPRNMF